MEKMVFKNEILNIVFGSLLIIFAFVGYFTKVVEDYLPIIVGIVIILFSIKRFISTFKKVENKNGTLILFVEFILDLVFAGLLIYLGKHVELFLGLVIYSRGVAYLIINFVSTRKVDLSQYIINIIYITFGSFLIFTSYNSLTFIAILLSVVLLLFGAVFLQFGIKKVMMNKKEKNLKEKDEQIEEPSTTELPEEVIVEDEEEKEIEDEPEPEQVEPEEKVDEVKEVQEEIETQEVKKVEKINYKNKTLVELKEIAKKRNLKGISKLNKADLIKKLEE